MVPLNHMDTGWDLIANPIVLITAFSTFIAAVFFELYLRHKKNSEDKHKKPHVNRIENTLDYMRKHNKNSVTVKKWMEATRVKKETAKHDLEKLVELGVLKKEGKGQGVHYCFVKKTKECKDCKK